MYKIVTVPNAILKKPVRKIAEIDNRIKKIAIEMAETLEKLDHPKGVGLAANQVGLDLAIFVFRDHNKIRPIINPQIIWHSNSEVLDQREKNTMLEGCLSIPNYYGTVKRYDRVKISYLDLDGKIREEEFGMPEAVIIQHETDHLNGKLFIEKLLQQKGKLYKYQDNKKEELVEVQI
jgi:peptide deformylase